MHRAFCPSDANATPVRLVAGADIANWREAAGPFAAAFAAASGFRADPGQLLLLPTPEGRIERAVFGVRSANDPFSLAALHGLLPPGDYRIEEIPPGWRADTMAVAWADGAYRFARYRTAEDGVRRLMLPDGVDSEDVVRQASASDWLRDLVNTPPSDLGPAELADAARALADEFGATCAVTTGATLASEFPLVHAVGRGSAKPPAFIELLWGDETAPRLALVGKGVTFDTGGLNIKTGPNMGLMKKDMGGAAHVLALARMIMSARLRVRLIVCIPAVENAVGGDAFRPSDVIRSRKGLTVEIEDTDAEGRLILADALTRACEHLPETIIDFATLTGAARVALGPDLAPLYASDEVLAADILAAAEAVSDPVWRMPLWDGYDSGLRSNVADLKNLGDGPMAGSVTAALFLRRFVTIPSWAHFDIWAWRPARFGRPAGGAPGALRAVWSVLRARYAG
jgi:leucyl aminopeptidase